jgi:uncharacterized membrane protein
MDLRGRYLASVGLLSAAAILLLGFRIVLSGTVRYWFVPENLALAWIALFLAWLLSKELKNRRWLSWQNLGLTVLWLLFLPNTWYVLTDYIHIFPNGEVSQLFDIVLMSLLVNVSDRIVDPFGSQRALNVTILFFLFISVIYLSFWIFSRPADPSVR